MAKNAMKSTSQPLKDKTASQKSLGTTENNIPADSLDKVIQQDDSEGLIDKICYRGGRVMAHELDQN